MDRDLLSLRQIYPDEVLADWTPGLVPQSGYRVRIQETGQPYDGWFGVSDSVLFSLVEDAGLAERECDVANYLALRFSPADAPFAAAAIRRATSRHLTVYGSRRLNLCCASLGAGSPWGFRVLVDALSDSAMTFRGSVGESDGSVLVVVFAGSPDFSDGCVTWAGVIKTDDSTLW